MLTLPILNSKNAFITYFMYLIWGRKMQENKIYKYGVFSADVKNMSDAELEASLQQLRDLTSRIKEVRERQYSHKVA